MKQSPQELGYPDTDRATPRLQQELERGTGQLERGTGRLSPDDTVRRAVHRLGYVRERPRHVLDRTPSAREERRIRRRIRGPPRRSVVLAGDETDLSLSPPPRAGWSLRGEPAVVHICGRDARRVAFGAMNPVTGTRLLPPRQQGRAASFQASLKGVRWHYRGPARAEEVATGRVGMPSCLALPVGTVRSSEPKAATTARVGQP